MNGNTSDGTGLSDRDRAIIDFEGTWWKYPGAKEQEIRERFDLSATRYYQILNALIARDDALAYSPVTVKRLRRLAEAKRAGRTRPLSHSG